MTSVFVNIKSRIFKESRQTTVICCLLIFGISIFVGFFNASSSGGQWIEDDGRYLNNGAMMRDYLISGKLLKPLSFAKENYAQYPGFSVPYHPVGYPLMLGVWFIVFGMSYESARFFTAICLGLLGCSFFGILKKQNLPLRISVFGSLLLVTSPEIMRWSRSNMSEIPALAFIVIASYCFFSWTEKNNIAWYYAAFLLAGTAFFCKVLSAGIIPAWFFFAMIAKREIKMLKASVLIPPFIYLVIGYIWTKFAASYAHHEIQSSVTDMLYRSISWNDISVWISALPSMVGWPIFLATLIVIIFWKKGNANRASKIFWVAWFISYYLFTLFVTTHFESRYLIFLLPGICAIASLLMAIPSKKNKLSAMVTGLIIAIICYNLTNLVQIPKGLTGNNIIANKLSQLRLPGNILLSCWWSSDLIFRYRCLDHKHKRRLIRGDRTLALRAVNYANVPTKRIAESYRDVIDILKKGRIRYVLTSTTSSQNRDNRPEDMILAHETVTSMPVLFTLLKKFDLNLSLNKKVTRHTKVYLWRFEGYLKEGRSELPVIIPTSNLIFMGDEF